jgi:long-chain acyl-CoA synthetase
VSDQQVPDGIGAVHEMLPGGSLVKLLAWRVAERPDFPFLYVEDTGPWTFGQIAVGAKSIAADLRRANVAPGDRVLVRLGNDERFLAGVVGVWMCGAAGVVMHPATPVTDLLRVVADFEVKAAVVESGDVGAGSLDIPIVSINNIDLCGSGTDGLDVPDAQGSDEAIILLTSGSTGAPKGVVLTHENAWSNLRATVSAFRRDTSPSPLPQSPKPPNMVANPFSHMGGMIRLLFALYVGRSLVVLRKFDPLKALAAVETHGIDNLTLNPTMLRMLIESAPPGESLGAVRYVSSGTAPLSPALREEFETRFGIPVLQVYGQTEAFGGVTIENVKDVLAGRRRPNSVGRPLPGVELRIVAADGSELAPRQDGEILVKTRSVTAGYAAGVGTVSSPVDENGWLHTGDLGHCDEDGYLYVTGRLKSLIICGGFNIVPEELETKLEGDPEVTEAAVVAVPDAKLGEIPVALVVGSGQASDILIRTRDYLVGYKRPRHLFVVDQLPRLTSGKVDKAAALRLVHELLAW